MKGFPEELLFGLGGNAGNLVEDEPNAGVATAPGCFGRLLSLNAEGFFKLLSKVFYRYRVLFALNPDYGG